MMTSFPDMLGTELAEKLGLHQWDCLKGKGGYWIKGKGFYTIAQARKITGIRAIPRKTSMCLSAYGDYATIALINRIKI